MEPSEQLRNVVERVLLLPVRVRHRRGARPKHKARIAALATTTATLQKARNVKAENICAVYNVALYLLLLDQDLAYLTDDLVCAIGDRRRRFVAKHEALLVYEAAEDLPQLLGKRFREAVTALGVPDQLARALDDVSSDLNAFWRQHRDFLGSIRKAVAAHREHDALSYQELLDKIEPLAVMQRAAELSALLQRLIGALTQVALLTASPAAILRDMLSSSSRRGARSGMGEAG
jgi:hypothetical protein